MITKQKGTYDIYGLEAKKRMYVNDILDAVCQKYNYSRIETPVFEASELFHRGVGETTDMVQKETYDFKDRGDRDITLRPEGTAGVVRWFIENKMYGNMTDPVKVYYNMKMYRYERPQSGRQREFTQWGYECFGSDDPMADAEVISLAYNAYRLMGLDNITVKLNTIGDIESRENYKKALREYLEPNIKDLCPDCQERFNKNVLRILDCKFDAGNEILKNVPKIKDYLNEDSLNRYNKLKELLDLMDINYVEDDNLVRGLDYYTHMVFEIVLDDSYALGGGGRYNNLVETLDGPSIPAVGFAMGYDRTLQMLEDKGIEIPVNDDVDVYLLYVSEDEKDTAAYLAQDLRLNGFICETDLMGKSLKAQFKSVDRFNSKYLIVLNDNDLKEDKVTIKDNKTKEEEKVSINDLVDYLDMHM